MKVGEIDDGEPVAVLPAHGVRVVWDDGTTAPVLGFAVWRLRGESGRDYIQTSPLVLMEDELSDATAFANVKRLDYQP